MATIKFILRYKVETTSSIYVRIRNGRNFDLTIKTPYLIKWEEWDDTTQRQINPYTTTPRNVEGKNHKTEINTLNNNLTLMEMDFNNFITINPNATKEEVKKYFDEKYFPTKIAKKQITPSKQKKKEVPELFTECIEHYIKEKSRRITGKQIPISNATHKKLTTIKNRITLFKKGLKLSQINDEFRDEFTDYMQNEKYSSSTIVKDLKYIKTVCKELSKKAKVSLEVLNWEFIHEKQSFVFPTFSFKELEQIKNTIYPNDYLDNAKDWLIIGCYTGARVSDLLEFNSKNIIDDNLLQFTQKKIEHQTADADEVIYLLPEIISILEKRNGEFPRKISDQKFNKYIKEVCKIAGIDNLIKGGKIGEGNKKEIGIFPKYELVTSHIMRRTFVTLYTGIIEKDLLKTQTGHRTDEMINHYDKTEKIDKAKQVRQKFETLLKIV